MSDNPELDARADHTRRRLVVATTTLGSIAVVATAVPFVASMAPSEQARAGAAPVSVDLSNLATGEEITVAWRGMPVWILHRSREMIESMDLPDHLARLRDPLSAVPQQPNYATNDHRSIKPEYSILVALCTHLGCIPTFRPDLAPGDLGSAWDGGYYCPCHGSRFDLAGRVYLDVPAPTNLVVPPHRYLADKLVEIGIDSGHT